MEIICGDWKIKPYTSKVCWSVCHKTQSGKWGAPMRYYDTLTGALGFCAEYDLMNGVDGEYDLKDAISKVEGAYGPFKRALLETERSENDG